ERASAAEQIELRHRKRVQRSSAVVRKFEVNVSRKRVLGRDVDVDDSVMLLTGGHGDRFQKIEGAQIALRLSQLSCIERLALAKEQESSNQLFRRSNGNHVDSAIQTSMARLFWIEDGRGVNCDFSDAQHRRRLDGQVTEAVERAREIAVAQCCQRVAVTAQIGVEKNDRRHANHIVRRTRSLALLVGKRGVTCPTHYEKVLVITTD